MSCWLPFMYFLHQPRMSREATMLIKAPLPSPEDTHCLSRCLTGIPLGNRICCSSLSSSQNDCIVELEGNLTICSVTTGRSPRPREVTERVQPVEVSPFPPSHHWACLLLPCFWFCPNSQTQQRVPSSEAPPCMFCSSSSQELAGQIDAPGWSTGLSVGLPDTLVSIYLLSNDIVSLSVIFSLVHIHRAWMGVCSSVC